MKTYEVTYYKREKNNQLKMVGHTIVTEHSGESLSFPAKIFRHAPNPASKHADHVIIAEKNQ